MLLTLLPHLYIVEKQIVTRGIKMVFFKPINRG